MARKVKQQIGTCECPFKGCSNDVPVFKYGVSDGAAADEARRRFAGRVYTICPSCGRSENQEFILCNAKLGTPSDDVKSPENTELKPPSVTPSETSATSLNPASTERTKPEKWWDNLRPIIQ